MIFLTYWFVAFACVAFPAYWAIPVPSVRRYILLASCVVFHTHFAGPAGVAPIVVLGAATYAAGRSRRRSACHAAIVLCVAALLFYKYTRFFCHELLSPFSTAYEHATLEQIGPWLPEVPPLAISFFVFEFVHYLVEVSRGGEPIRNAADFTLFSIFWPSIVAGPIKRYREFIESLYQGAGFVGQQDVAVGMARVAIGLVKKFIADNLTAYIAFYDDQLMHQTPAWRWFFLTCIALRILFDFSGYSDIAVGFGRMHGIRLPENFNWPYAALSLQDFWRRWHISLSTWIRDYIYIALGGGRVGPARKVFNGLLAFGLCGLWHGAAWNFILWGLMHGAGLAVSANYRALLGPLGELFHKALQRLPVVSWLITLLFVMFTWLFFFYPAHEAWAMLKLFLPQGLARPLEAISAIEL